MPCDGGTKTYRFRNERKYYLTALTWDADFYYAAAQYLYYTVSPGFDAGHRSFPLPKNSPIRRDLDLLASTLTQFGHTRAILRK